MRVIIYNDVAYVGTATEREFEIPEDIVSQGEVAISDYIHELEEKELASLTEILSVWSEVVEEEEEE
jgi:hypothetical protein